jgi:S1-C subfamily serine protease
MDRTAQAPLRPSDGEDAPARGRVARPRVIAAAIATLIAVSAAAGFLVTMLAPAGGVGQAGRSVVALTTTLVSGATVTGTGVILTASGEVVTSYGVVNGAVSIAAAVAGTGSHYAATTFALDPTDGVAVLQLLDATGLPSASVGISAGVAVGDHVTALGGPGPGGAVAQSQGAVTALGRTTAAAGLGGTAPETLNTLITFNATLPRDGAGGPLVSTSGSVIGLDVAGTGRPAQSASGTGNGFAIPIGRVLAIVHDVVTHTPSPNILEGHGAFLGIDVQDSAAPPGAVIVAVQPGTPAEVAGLAAGDVIVSIDGIGVGSVLALRGELQRFTGGDRVVVGWTDPGRREHSESVQLAAATFA